MITLKASFVLESEIWEVYTNTWNSPFKNFIVSSIATLFFKTIHTVDYEKLIYLNFLYSLN